MNIYDFPTNYRDKLDEVDVLLEKNYIDQAICLLEDWLETTIGIDNEIKIEVLKKIYSCYLIKREFESCEDLVLELKGLGKIDLTIIAYDVLNSLFQGEVYEAEDKKINYQKQLQLSPFAYKNLVELIFQLKTFYEELWFQEASKKFERLREAENFEGALHVLSDLQSVEKDFFLLHKKEIKLFFENSENQILKTLLFELLTQKELIIEVSFKEEREKKLNTTIENLYPLYELIQESKKELIKLNKDEMTTAILEQHLVMFYQFMFPFLETIEIKEVIKALEIAILGLNSDEKSEERLNSKEKAKTLRKINEYLLSLSLLN